MHWHHDNAQRIAHDLHGPNCLGGFGVIVFVVQVERSRERVADDRPEPHPIVGAKAGVHGAQAGDHGLNLLLVGEIRDRPEPCDWQDFATRLVVASDSDAARNRARAFRREDRNTDAFGDIVSETLFAAGQ